MAIEIDVIYAATVKQRPDVSAIVDLTGALGSTMASGTVSEEIGLDATASGARLALRGDISAVVDPSGLGKRLIMVTNDQTSPYDSYSYREFYWYMESTWTMEYYEEIIHPTPLTTPDAYGDTSVEMPLSVSSTVTVVPIVSIELPDAPQPPPPAEPSGNFPMPTAGGIIVRAVPGIAVQVDTPVIVDGRPT